MTVTKSYLQISEYFDINETSWGGRACFSKRDLNNGQVVLEVEDCMGTSIDYDFRKEVCHYCYKYNNGKSMKVKISFNDLQDCLYEFPQLATYKAKFKGAGLWFCCDTCRDKYLSIHNIAELIESYEILLESFMRMIKNKSLLEEQEQDYNGITITKEYIDNTWEDITTRWIPMVSKTKATKRAKFLPQISEDEYNCCRFVIETLFRIKHLDPGSDTLEAFHNLQSNELSKIQKFPVLLNFQVLVFKTLFVLLPDNLKNSLTVQAFRHILGSEYGNAFGIWQDTEAVDSREYFGYWVFPKASYFNHSCDPNITKTRIDRKMVFTLNRDVACGEELNIDYSGVLDLPVDRRQKFLFENWFFVCGCNRCNSDLKLVH
ncbi:SET domain profile [Nakaseomyces glabratus]|nr:SET domain profile [Nakaseomyces glabratus]